MPKESESIQASHGSKTPPVPVVDGEPLRVLYAVPGKQGGVSMVFAHAEIARLAQIGVTTQKVPFTGGTNPLRFIREVIALRRAVAAFRPHLVHAHFGTVTAFACALGVRVPLVITFRGSDLNPSPSDGMIRSALQKLLSQLAALRARAVICVSPQLLGRLWWGREKGTILPTGVDLEVFRPLPRAEARRHVGWSDDERVVVFNAGTTPLVKRLDIAESVLRLVQDQVGYVRLFAFRGLTAHEQLPFYLNAADCLIMTSDFEGSPDIIKEAMACNLPIVSFDVGDVVERLRRDSVSKIVPRDPGLMADAVAQIILRGQRSRGRETIGELSASRVRDRILVIYHAALARSNTSRPTSTSFD